LITLKAEQTAHSNAIEALLAGLSGKPVSVHFSI
jgi:hypothetical protein